MTTLPELTEREFTSQLRDLAKRLGWLRYHTWLAAHSTAGFPDECLVRPPRVVFAELKRSGKDPTPAQRDWLDALDACDLEVYLWRPSMIDEIAALLALPTRPPTPGVGAWPKPPQNMAI